MIGEIAIYGVLLIFSTVVVVVLCYATVDIHNFVHRKIVTRRRMATLLGISVDQWMDLSPEKLISNCERKGMITCKWPITTTEKNILTLTIEVEEIDFGYEIDYLLTVMGDGNAFGKTDMFYMNVAVDALPNLKDALRIISL